MARIHARMLGAFRTSSDGRSLVIDSLKTREMFGYLLLHRGRGFHRETLAGTLWGDVPTPQARKQVRQSLWQLQSALDTVAGGDQVPILRLTGDLVAIEATDDLWLDLTEVELAFAAASETSASDLGEELAGQLRRAVDLYEGDLLEGWYHDWCLHDRERLQAVYLSLLDKLMVHCELSRAFDTGIDYGMRALRYDPARELTHRRLMRLHFLSGDRTMALRQYERCAAVLTKELDVRPARATTRLYEQIKDDQLDPPHVSSPATPRPRLDVLGRIEEIQAALTDLRLQLRGELPPGG